MGKLIGLKTHAELNGRRVMVLKGVLRWMEWRNDEQNVFFGRISITGYMKNVCAKHKYI